MQKIKKVSGFTLIELLIVVAIIGIIAAIAIPNLLNAIDRGKQKRTMSDMRSVGTAVESYAVDVNFYPYAGFTTLAAVDGGAMGVSPIYIKVAPEKDGWGGLLMYAAEPFGAAYTIQSYGKDKTAGITMGPTNDFDCDILYQNGTFVAYPEGVQQ
jgi:type II secretion system protein G